MATKLFCRMLAAGLLLAALQTASNSRTSQASVAAPYPAAPRAIPFALNDRLASDINVDVDGFGASVAISGDFGIVGAPEKDINGNEDQGEAYIIAKTSDGWELQQRLTAPAGKAKDEFGRSVTIDGDTAAVCYSQFPGYEGAAYVYVRNGDTWAQQAELRPANDDLISNCSVALSGDTLVIGTYSNRAYVFVRAGETWTQEAKLVSSDARDFDYFGSSVAISGDTIILGAFGDDSGTQREERGSAYIFTRRLTRWTETAKIMAPDSVPFGQFGTGVDIDGDTAVIGSILAPTHPGLNQGAAYVFVRNSGAWEFQQKVFAPETTNVGFFGSRVTVSGDVMAASAPRSIVDPVGEQGTVYVFSRSGTTWTQSAKLSAPDGKEYLRFGSEVAANGDTVLVGAGGDLFSGFSEPGAAYVYGNADTAAPDLQAGSDSGVSSTDDLTNSRSPAFAFTGAVQGATVELLRNNVQVSRTTADGSTITLSDNAPPANGTYQYNVRQVLPDKSVLRSAAEVVRFDTIVPTVTINQPSGPPAGDPTNSSQVAFLAVFSEPVVGFEGADVSFEGSTANVSQAAATISGDFPTYAVTVSGYTSDGQILRASIPAGVVSDPAGNSNAASTSTDNSVTIDNVRPTMTIDQAAGQADPTTKLPINFAVVFSESVSGFDANDISLAGSTEVDVSNARITITGSGSVYSVAVDNVKSNGGVLKASIDVRYAVNDRIGNGNEPSTSTDNSVTLDNLGPSVTINQSEGQADPATPLPINFTAVFSEPVTEFDASDVSLAGSTANVSHANIAVSGSGTTYNVVVSNVASAGLVRATIPLFAAVGTDGNPSLASTSTDNVVRYSPVFVEVKGRVTLANGMSGTNSLLMLTLPSGEQRFTRANPFGYYRFVGVPTSNITINVVNKRSIGLSTSFFLQPDYPDVDLVLP